MNNRTITQSIAYYGDRAIIWAVIAEMLFFFSLPNMAGCLMTVVCWVIFKRVGLKEEYIINHLFPWLIFLSMSLYRVLPLLATLMEFKPISYGFRVPFETFFGETFLYAISALAFYLVVRKRSNNGLKRLSRRIGLFRTVTPRQLWILGFAGLLVRLYFQVVGGAQMGDAVGKFLITFTFLCYAPLLLAFPTLYKYRGDEQDYADRVFTPVKSVIIYLVALTIYSLSGNSRYGLIEPVGTFFILYFVAVVKSRQPLRVFVKPKIVIGFVAVLLFVAPFMSNISLAMLSVRGIRSDLSSSELFQETIEMALDSEKIRELKRASDMASRDRSDESWTEDYLDNFAFNRYCNIRVSDVGLYHAQIVESKGLDYVMRENLLECVLKFLPTPALQFLNLDIDKNDHYSRGDLLKSLSYGTPLFHSLIVTSHIGDGVVTFGLLYFPIQFLLFLLEFCFVDAFSYFRREGVINSTIALIVVFSFLGQFRNANGCVVEIGYILRGFWQHMLIFAVALKAVSFIKSY